MFRYRRWPGRWPKKVDRLMNVLENQAHNIMRIQTRRDDGQLRNLITEIQNKQDRLWMDNRALAIDLAESIKPIGQKRKEKILIII